MPGNKTVKKITPPVQSEEPVKVTGQVTVSQTEQPSTAPVQKGGKKNKASIATTQPVVAVQETSLPSVVAVEESTSTPVVAVQEVQSVKPANKRGGGKTSKVMKPTVESDVVTTKKTKSKAKSVELKSTTEISDQTAGKVKSPKVKKAVKKADKKVDKPVNSGENELEVDEIIDKHTRSFKVKLPNKEEFEGRFTGLTPYQAANKALSKYFRETENPQEEIIFLICESTRKSKKLEYTYIGKRYKLDEPVRYKIQDGREIVKNFKNSLKKVKKDDLAEMSGGKLVQEVVPPVATV